ncbi:hypothetical protein O5967_12700 [Escherichia coli]|nr:hypothetical protein [Escherichia coli]MCZ5267802.1 hypothetical protein [Escherichia coli]
MTNSGRKNCFLYGVMAGWYYASNPEPFAEGSKSDGDSQERCGEAE